MNSPIKITHQSVTDEPYEDCWIKEIPNVASNIDVEYIREHIQEVLEKAGDLKKLKFIKKQEDLKDFLNTFGFGIEDMEKVFSLDVSIPVLAYFYWIYKRNFFPWKENHNFILYMNMFKDIFEGKHNIYINSTEEDIKISLGIIFYFDKLMHN